VKVTLFTAPGCPLGFNAERQELQLMWHYGHAIETERCMIVLAERSATREAIGLSPDRLAANRERLTRLYGMPMGLRHQSFAVGAAREELEGAGATFTPSANDGYWEA
jgi:hypothetical protein